MSQVLGFGVEGFGQRSRRPDGGVEGARPADPGDVADRVLIPAAVVVSERQRGPTFPDRPRREVVEILDIDGATDRDPLVGEQRGPLRLAPEVTPDQVGERVGVLPVALVDRRFGEFREDLYLRGDPSPLPTDP